MFQFVLGANLAVDVSRSSHGMFVYEYLSWVVDDSSAASLRATGSVRRIESPAAAKAGTDDSVMAAPRAAAPAALAATLPATCGWFGASAAAPIASASTTFIVACAGAKVGCAAVAVATIHLARPLAAVVPRAVC